MGRPKEKSIQRFGQYLINRGKVSEEDILDALDIQKRQTVPVGKIALAQKILTRKQVLKILNAQADTTKYFGEVAIELGYLSKEDIDKLLKIQNKKRPRIGEILIAMQKIDENTLNEELENYRNQIKDQMISTKVNS